MNFSDDYQDPEFSLDVMIKDNTDDFLIEVAWDISSDYIYELLKPGKANLYLIIKSKDNQLFKLQPKKKALFPCAYYHAAGGAGSGNLGV